MRRADHECRRHRVPGAADLACLPAAAPLPCSAAWGWAASGTTHDAWTPGPVEEVPVRALDRASGRGQDALCLRDGLELLRGHRTVDGLAIEGRRRHHLRAAHGVAAHPEGGGKTRLD